jgi:hypothetical protein
VITSEILPEEVEFHPLSFADKNGRLFWRNGELYRGISLENTDLCRRLFEESVIQNLMKKGLLIETEISPFSMNNYPLILKHRVVNFVSYAYEWPFSMLKDAALALLDIAIELAHRGFALQDAHPWNMLFDGSKPIYVDFGSIIPARSDGAWPAAGEFYRFFVYPLRLMSHGHGRIARWLLHDYEQGIFESECKALVHPTLTHVTQGLRSLLRTAVPAALRPGLNAALTSLRSARSTRLSRSASLVDFLQKLRAEVEKIGVYCEKTQWSTYYDNGYFLSLTPSSEWTAKHKSVHNILAEITPQSVLDIGSNRGWYSQLAASLGINTVAFDNDETAVNRLYCDVKNQKLSILPLVVNFRDPSPANQIMSAANDRLKCDMVLALALVHHLVFKHFLRFEHIVGGFESFTKRKLLVEFIPKDDQFVSQWWSPQYGWYTLENFIAELRRYFNNVSIYPSDPKPRVLLLCEK